MEQAGVFVQIRMCTPPPPPTNTDNRREYILVVCMTTRSWAPLWIKLPKENTTKSDDFWRYPYLNLFIKLIVILLKLAKEC